MHFLLQDNNIERQNDNNMQAFYALIYTETTGYLARAAVNKVLQGGALSTLDENGFSNGTDHLHDETCHVS